MEGLSKITYKGKEIIYVNYTFAQDKEKTIKLIKDSADEVCKWPLKSSLQLINVEDFRFDKEIADAMKAIREKTKPHEKKVAIFGLKPIHKALFNFAFAIQAGNSMKVFNTEIEAKEWLVSDK